MNKKIIAGLSAVALLAAGASGAALHGLMAEPKVVEVEKLVTVPVDKVVPGPTVFVDKIVEVPVEDKAFKTMACDRLHYDLVAECEEEVKAEDAAIKLAVEAIEADFANELEDADIVAKEKYAELVKIYSKFEDLNVTESDFDSGDYSFEIKAKVKDSHEEDKMNVLFTVDVKDGEAEIKDVELI